MTEPMLQSDDDNLDIDEAQTLNDEGSELAPDAGETQSKNDDGKVDQDKINAAINKQHFLRKEAEREAEKERQKREELEQRLAKLESGSDVTIPDLPDPFDDNFDEKIRLRDEAIMRKAEQDAMKKRQTEQQTAQREADEQAKLEAFNKKAEVYKNRATSLGIKPDEMEQAGNLVGQYINNQDIAEFILEHENGPLIVKHLSRNPLVLDEIAGMGTVQAILKLNNDVAREAALLKPRASDAPNPPDEIEGRGGAIDKDSPFLKGAKFD